jgi:uncharacterized protein (UPF0335 family)
VFAVKIDAERLRGFLDCMHDEADERDKRSAQISAIVKAAKEAGYDTKAVRKVFVRERMDEAERTKQDDLLETYEGALGGKGRALRAIEAGVPVGEACEANGVHRATVARARHGNPHVANETSNATPHDPETGEIKEAAFPGDDAGHRSEPSSPAEKSVNPAPPPERASLGHENGEGTQSGTTTPTGEDDEARSLAGGADGSGRDQVADQVAEDHRSDDGPVDGLRGGPEAEGGHREGDEGSGDRGDPRARSEGIAAKEAASTDPNDDAFRARVKAIAATLRSPVAAEYARQIAGDDPGPIPSFLRRANA